MQTTLAIVHFATSAGSIRVSVSQVPDGTLVAERIGSKWPYVFPVKVAEISPGEDLDEDASTLFQLAVDDIETFAEITETRPLKLH